MRRAFYEVRTHRQWRDETRVEHYLCECRQVVQKVEDSLTILEQRESAHAKNTEYVRHRRWQIEQVEHLLIKKEVIPHCENVFSIHEEHTRWINKGKAGMVAEVGVQVCVLEDQYQFILRHHILW